MSSVEQIIGALENVPLQKNKLDSNVNVIF